VAELNQGHSETMRRLVDKYRPELDEWLAGEDTGPAEHTPGTCAAQWCDEAATYLVHADTLNDKGVIVYLLWQDFEDVAGPNPEGHEMYCDLHARHVLSDMALLAPHAPDVARAMLLREAAASTRLDRDETFSLGPQPRELWNTTEVATYLGVKPGTVSAYRHRGQMPAPVQTSGERTHLWDAATIRAWHAERG